MLAALFCMAACTNSGVFECSSADQCAADGQEGTCESNGFCSFPDEACPSGRRYGMLAPPDLAGMCVADDASSTGAAMTSMASTGVPEGTSTPTPASTGMADAGTTIALEDTGPPVQDSSTGPEGTSTTGPIVPELQVVASLAACNEPLMPDPLTCTMSVAEPLGQAITVDGDDMGLGPYNSYLRFDFGAELVPGAVTSITLEMTVTDSMSAGASSSGEVYEVEPFTLADLSMFQPMPLGAVLGPDQGAVVQGQVVQWPLPPDLLDDGRTSLYLGVLAIATSGVDYWSNDGLEPPVLIIEQMR